MIELHGWLTIRETFEANFDEDNINGICIKIKNVIADMIDFKPIIQWKNGECFSEFSIYSNHNNLEVEEAISFFDVVGKIAKGSYGLLYLHDDENSNGFDNQFQVIILCRGKIRQCSDSYLSPFIPNVEDAYGI